MSHTRYLIALFRRIVSPFRRDIVLPKKAIDPMSSEQHTRKRQLILHDTRALNRSSMSCVLHRVMCEPPPPPLPPDKIAADLGSESEPVSAPLVPETSSWATLQQQQQRPHQHQQRHHRDETREGRSRKGLGVSARRWWRGGAFGAQQRGDGREGAFEMGALL